MVINYKTMSQNPTRCNNLIIMHAMSVCLSVCCFCMGATILLPCDRKKGQQITHYLLALKRPNRDCNTITNSNLDYQLMSLMKDYNNQECSRRRSRPRSKIRRQNPRGEPR